ncbi:Leucine Rich Repeat [Seminavis robusta]|uniref:Leucine Rich Repeat n=1 Tax=Seminavis robusta TaxID=568900 RepID=A0A9N8HAH2_9STRA|nr:Leucine Rich Repeat [Seminavis robusta]|eukprot:Sro320_g116430.1 Leucine Rich Repeat (688) ;mRNA; r:8583-10646
MPHRANGNIVDKLVAKGHIPLQHSGSILTEETGTGTREKTLAEGHARNCKDMSASKAVENQDSNGTGEVVAIGMETLRQRAPEVFIADDGVPGAYAQATDLGHSHVAGDGIPGAYAFGGIGDESTEQETDLDQSHGVALPAPNNNTGIPSATPVEDLERAEEVVGGRIVPARGSDKMEFPWAWGFWLLLVVVVVVIPTVLVREAEDGSVAQATSSSPSFAPSPSPTIVFILDLPMHTKEAILDDPESSQFQAYQWIQNDPNRKNYTQGKLMQRFVLATLYYATNGDDWFGNDKWLNYDADECHDWFNLASLPPLYFDVCTTEGDFNALVLVHNSMKGTLPRELGLLTGLQALILGDGFLNGPIPSEIWELPILWVLAVYRNQLTGTLPPEGMVAAQSSKSYLDLAGNQLSGRIPSELGLSRHLSHFSVGDNQMTGTLPEELGNIATLEYLGLNANGFTGTIQGSPFQGWGNLTHLFLRDNLFTGQFPTEVGLLTSLEELYIYNNSFSGSLPSELGNLGGKTLRRIVVSNNIFNGSISDSIWHLSGLEELQVDLNFFTGTLPSDCGVTLGSALRMFDVALNQFHGTIPSSIGLWTDLRRLDLRGNDFEGSLPSEVWQMSSLRELWVGSNLKGYIPPNASFPAMEAFNLSGSMISGTIPNQLCNSSSKLDVLDYSCSEILCGCDCPCGR